MNKLWGVLAPLALLAMPALAQDAPPGCAWLCGKWVLETARSDSAESIIDAALEKYRDPEPPRAVASRRDSRVGDFTADAPPPGPSDRPMKAELRSQLLVLLTPPATLVLGEKGEEILIQAAGAEERRVYPGEPHSRVTADGTIKISTEWKKDALVVNEDQGRGREQTDTYALLPDGNLQVTRVVARPGARQARLRAVYRRG